MTPPTDRLSIALAERYRIERELGQGGMATVYLAHDARHDRKVALKVLRPELAAVIGAERFLQEIKVTANLQHPHILPLHDSGEVDGTVFYVMPYVEGESLRDRLTREKQLPVDDAVRIAVEVAGALEYAHQHQVIHRDIKPENILLHGGHALVADFGIALAAARTGGARLTETGLSLGTPYYMSPEQAGGDRDLDARADVYALGCVLYEMLVGEPPFTAPTVQAMIARVMTERPTPLSQTRDTVPAHVEEAVLTALAKLRADRQASAAVFAAQLTGAAVVRRSPGPTPRRDRASRWSWPLGVAATGLLALGWLGGRLSAPGERAPGDATSRLALLTPGLGGSGAGGNNRQLALVPDGSAVVYVVGHATGAQTGLVVQHFHEETPHPIPGSEFTYAPAVSRDGAWIAARTITGEVTVLPFAGTRLPPEPIARGLSVFAWHPDGSLWLTRVPFRRVERYRPETGTLDVVLDSLPVPVLIQQVLDDGGTALVVQAPAGATGGPLLRLDLATGVLSPLLSDAVVTARYGGGLLAYAGLNGTLLVRAFEPASGRLGGRVTVVAQNVSVAGIGEVQFDLSSEATLVYVPEEPRALVMVDRNGVERLLTQERYNYHMPRFSPDGRRLVTDFVTAEGRDVWILDPAQQTITRATFDRDAHDAEWAPDGLAITYLTSRDGELGIFRITPGAGTAAESLLVSPHIAFSGIWSPDGRDLLTVATDLARGSAQDIAVIRNEGRGPIEPLVATRFREEYPALSRDGRWVAFVSDQSGRPEVYVLPWSGGGALTQVSQGGGSEPMWSPDGRELFYLASSASGPVLMSARLALAPTITVVERTILFPAGDFVTSTPHTNYDIAPDGQRFVMVRRNPAARIMVIQNLRALVARLDGRALSEL